MEYEKAQAAAEYIRSHVGDIPKIAIICGSGLGGIVNELSSDAVELPYADIPHFKSSTVQGHAGKIVVGAMGPAKVPVFCVAGRLHTYEGHDIKDTVFAVRVFAILKVHTLIVTNAAGGLNPDYKVGDLMVINDHLNFPGMAGLNPLKGPNCEQLGDRFTPMNNAYAHELRHKFYNIAAATSLGRSLHEGTYAFVSGPNYETAAECRMLLALGGDAVGMSTVPEVLAAQHSGINVLGISLITNEAITAKPRAFSEDIDTSPKVEPTHAEVLAEADKAAKDLQGLVTEFVKQISQ